MRSLRSLADETLAHFVNPDSLILHQWSGQGKSTPKLCLFAHFDPENRIDPYVVYYLRKLSEVGCEIHFISTSEGLTSREIQPILPYCRQIIARKNFGIDFGSWKVGMLNVPGFSHSKQTQYQQLILANDSVYGPLEYPTLSFSEVLKTMDARNLDFWGITASEEITPHVQSYFLVFGPHALSSEFFWEFWNSFKFYRSKYRNIARYELKLSSLANQAGWRQGVWIDPRRFALPSKNSTLFEWPKLIQELQCPILKTETLRLNRGNISEAKTWKDFLKKHTLYPTELIENHLKRT